MLPLPSNSSQIQLFQQVENQQSKNIKHQSHLDRLIFFAFESFNSNICCFLEERELHQFNLFYSRWNKTIAKKNHPATTVLMRYKGLRVNEKLINREKPVRVKAKKQSQSIKPISTTSNGKENQSFLSLAAFLIAHPPNAYAKENQSFSSLAASLIAHPPNAFSKNFLLDLSQKN